MGIKNLLINIRKDFPQLITTTSLKETPNSTYFIDASIYFYKYFISMRYTNRINSGVIEFKDQQGNKTAHLIGLIALSRTLLMNRIRPVFVLDGAPDVIKEATVT